MPLLLVTLLRDYVHSLIHADAQQHYSSGLSGDFRSLKEFGDPRDKLPIHLDELGRDIHEAEVGLQHLGHAGLLHLDHHVLARLQPSLVHLHRTHSGRRYTAFWVRTPTC